MEIQFNHLERLSSTTLELLRDETSRILQDIQNTRVTEEIVFWVDLQSMVWSILNERKNG